MVSHLVVTVKDIKKFGNIVVTMRDLVTRHSKYRKIIHRKKRMDVKNLSGVKVSVGDKVYIKNSKPFSKTISWELVSVLVND
jgi:ribosomal protein S17